jgi:transcriptional regulator with XRE-family HTH domain
MSLGERTRKRRQVLKLTQHELAEALGLTSQHISAIEQNKRSPSLAILARLAEELGVTVDYLVTGKEGVITDTIPAIKADKRLRTEVKKALITTIRALYGEKSGS